VRWRFFALASWGLLIVWSLPALAGSAGNCVAYARELTGIQLDGNAAAWWPRAEGRYDRGHQPMVGAILVFKPAPTMRVGHVAVVSHVVGPREVLVDQANWIPGRITKAMSVVDASSLNDWSSVKVLEPQTGKLGRENAAFGFIYPRALPASLSEAAAVTPQADRRRPEQTARAAEPAARETARPDRHQITRPVAAAASNDNHRAHGRQASADKTRGKVQHDSGPVRQVDAIHRASGALEDVARQIVPHAAAAPPAPSLELYKTRGSPDLADRDPDG
jgi:surface antigen